MLKHINNVVEFCRNAGQPVPENITEPSNEDKILRARLIMEEALEMVYALGVYIQPKSSEIHAYSADDFTYYATGRFDSVGVADAAVDILWVGVTGPMVLCGMADKLEACIEEVDASNLSKFIDGHRDENTGKWIKGPSYKPANIEGIINA